MDSSRQAYGKFFISILFSNNWPKTGKYSYRLNIDRDAIYYISNDLTRRALQTNGKFFFFLILKSFLELV